MISILPPCRPDRFLFRGLVAVLRIAALLVAIATFSAVAVSQTVNDPEIALVQNRFETYRDAVNEVRAAQTRDWHPRTSGIDANPFCATGGIRVRLDPALA